MNASSSVTREVYELYDRLAVIEAVQHLDDSDNIINRAMQFYGNAPGLLVVLRLLEQHLNSPQLSENDGSTHSEAFIPGVGPVQVSLWPANYYVEGEQAYLVLSFAADGDD